MDVLPYRDKPVSDAASAPLAGPAGRLLGFGLVLVGLGSICGFFALMIPVVALLGAGDAARGAGFVWTALVPPVVLISLIAIALVWAGIGSIRLRRWARPVILAGAGLALFAGATTLFQIGFGEVYEYGWYSYEPLSSPTPRTPPPRRGSRATAAQARAQAEADERRAMWVIVGGTTILGVALPLAYLLAYLLAYRGREVAAVLDAADPRVNWTDGCPTPALGLAMGFAYAAAACFVLTPAMMSIPLTPTATGSDPLLRTALVVGYLVVGGLCALTAWLVYRARPAGPWLAIVLIALLSAGITAGAAEMVLDGATATPTRYSPDQALMLAQLASIRGVISILAFAVPAVIFVLHVRRVINETPRAQGVSAVTHPACR